MRQKLQAIILITIVFIVIVTVSRSREGFTSKRAKAQAIHDWFANEPDPKYIKYKNDLAKSSNIVEYEDVLTLKRNHNLTVESIEKTI